MRTVIVNASLLCLALVASPTFAADSCGGGCPTPPKNARAVSAELIPLGDFCSAPNTLTATLAKGKKKTILYADGLLTDGAAGGAPIPREYTLGIKVNGLQMQPQLGGSCGDFPIGVAEDCGSFRSDPDINCTVAGH